MIEAMNSVFGLINTAIFLADAARLSVVRALANMHVVAADAIAAIARYLAFPHLAFPHLAFPADPVSSGVHLSSRPIGGRGSASEWSASAPVRGAGLMRPDGVESCDLPVRVLFEIGRLDLAFDEIEYLEVGATLPLARGGDYAVNIVMSGKRIGRGELVKIGKQLGVRVTRLFDQG